MKFMLELYFYVDNSFDMVSEVDVLLLWLEVI